MPGFQGLRSRSSSIGGRREGAHLLCLSFHQASCTQDDAPSLVTLDLFTRSSESRLISPTHSRAHPEITFYLLSGHALGRSSWKHKINCPALPFARKHTAVFQNGCTTLHPHQQGRKVLFCVDPSVSGVSVLDLGPSPVSHCLFNVYFLPQNNLYSFRNRDMKGELIS